MKVYNVTVDGLKVSTTEVESKAYEVCADLMLMMLTSKVEVVESFIEERGV